MAVDVYDSLKALVDKIMGGDRDAALQYAGDPYGTLAEQGITDGDLGQTDMYQLVSDCASGHDLPTGAQQAFQGYSSGAPAPAHYQVPPPPPYDPGHQSVQDVVQHLNYVTYATYEGDDTITQQLINQEIYDYSTNIDNSVDVDVDGEVHGDLDVDTTNVNATGDGAVAAGDDVENAATGDGSQVIDGDNFGQANTGDGAVLAGGDIEAPVNTGVFTGVQADGDVENTVVGDDNQSAQVSGEADNSVFNFGDGDVTNFGDADIEDSAVSVGGGDANNVSDNFLEEGAAAAAGGDAEGNFEETDVEAFDSIVATEQGPGDLEQEENELEQEVAGA
jgi:hypothetical protein